MISALTTGRKDRDDANTRGEGMPWELPGGSLVPCQVAAGVKGADSSLGFRTERENLAGDAKGKGPRGGPARPKVPMRRGGRTTS